MKRLALLLGALWVGGLGAEECYRLVPESQTHHFVLVIDRSGSMAGEPLRRALEGAGAFIAGLQAGDRAAVVAFDDKVDLLQGLSPDRAALKAAVDAIRPGGATALYDALGRAGGLLAGAAGPKIIVFMTDGADTGSRFSADEIASWARSEGIFVYGIGLGRVDEKALRALVGGTGGALQTAAAAKDLGQVYRKTLKAYYRDFGAQATGGAVLRSLPAGAEVRFEGQVLGPSPLKMDKVPPGEYRFSLAFGRGEWNCRAPVVAGHRTLIDARETDLGHDLWILSRPHGAVVFIDGAYTGVTGLHPADTRSAGWGAAVKADSRHLRVAQVPAGAHKVRLVAMPEMDYGPEQQVEIDLDLAGGERVLVVDILQGRAALDDGRQVRISRGERLQEMEDEVDKLMGGEDPFDF